jgi:type II restriction enzyme
LPETIALAAIRRYTSSSQQARVFSEAWIEENFSCPQCGNLLTRTPNNTVAKDFICAPCNYSFELKAKKGMFGKLVADGAYQTMLSSIRSDACPHLLLLSYTQDFRVHEVTAVPRQFLVEEIVLPRKVLGPHCRRAGWQGCNLNIGILPTEARIKCVANYEMVPGLAVRTAWSRADFLTKCDVSQRGWLAVTMGLVRQIGAEVFSLADLYQFEPAARKLFPNNKHIKEKLRQQLQRLRDLGWLSFEGSGTYRILNGLSTNESYCEL